MPIRIKKSITDHSENIYFWLFILFLITVLVTLVMLDPLVIWADPPPPTILQIESARVYRHLAELSDFLVVFHYNIHYDSEQPDESTNKLFTFRLLQTNGTDLLGATVPFAYYNSGYDQGCASFYFPALNAPVWNLTYVIRISGNPEYFSSPPVTSKTLLPSDYSSYDTPEGNQTVLGNYIIEIATKLETNWSTRLLFAGELGTVLNAAGDAYFKGAVPGLPVMAPQVFALQTTSPEYEETDWTSAKGTFYEERFKNTWIGKSLAYFGEQFHIKWNVITGILTLGVIIALAIFCQAKYGSIKPVMIGGACVLLGGTVMGWVAPAIMAIVTIFMALFLGYVWMFRTG